MTAKAWTCMYPSDQDCCQLAWKAPMRRSSISRMALSVAAFSMMVQPSSRLSWVMICRQAASLVKLAYELNSGRSASQ